MHVLGCSSPVSEMFGHLVFGRAHVAEPLAQLGHAVPPEALGDEVEKEQSGNQQRDVDADPSRLSPVDVLQLQEERELVQHERQAYAERNRQDGMPFCRLQAQREEAAHRDKGQAPDVVMEVDRSR